MPGNGKQDGQTLGRTSGPNTNWKQLTRASTTIISQLHTQWKKITFRPKCPSNQRRKQLSNQIQTSEILQQRNAQTEETIKVSHNTKTQSLNNRFSELAKLVAETSSAANLETGTMTTSSGQEVSSWMSGNQVRDPTEARALQDKQTGAAAPSQNRKAGNNFKGDHTFLPIHPPSSESTMSAEFSMLARAMQSEDRLNTLKEEARRDEEQNARQGRPPVDDTFAALTAMLRPKPPTRPTQDSNSNEAAVSAATDLRTPLVTDMPPYPAVEIHALPDGPEWRGQPIGTPIGTPCDALPGNALTDWTAADSQAAKGTKGERMQRETSPETRGVAEAQVCALRHCLDTYPRYTEREAAQNKGDTSDPRDQEGEPDRNDTPAPGISRHKTGMPRSRRY